MAKGIDMIRAILFALLLVHTANAQHWSACEISTGTAGGSGVLIVSEKANGFAVVLTAQHVIEGTPRFGRVDAYFPELRRSFSGKLITMNSQIDIAAVLCPYIPLKASPIAKRMPSVGSPVATTGFPAVAGNAKQGWFAELFGKITRVQPGGQYNTSVQPRSGNSGGPAYNANGELIGLINGYRGNIGDGDPVKSFGPAFYLDQNCQSIQWLVRGWTEHGPRDKKTDTCALMTSLGFGRWRQGGGGAADP